MLSTSKVNLLAYTREMTSKKTGQKFRLCWTAQLNNGSPETREVDQLFVQQDILPAFNEATRGLKSGQEVWIDHESAGDMKLLRNIYGDESTVPKADKGKQPSV